MVHLSMFPHAGTWAEGDVVRQAASFNAPPIAAGVEAHPGTWPAAGSLARCTPSNVVLTAIKVAEDGEDLILRGYETAGRETEAEIRLGLESSKWTATWRPYEIKTLRLQQGSNTLVEVNMLEESDVSIP
jgi:alpha-mannosidase